MDWRPKGDLLDAPTLKRASTDTAQALRAVRPILPHMRSTRFRRRADFYSLVTLLIQVRSDGHVVQAGLSKRHDLAGDLLTVFGHGVDQVSVRSASAKPAPAGHQQHVKYLMTVKEGTDSPQQRKKRAALLGHLLEGVFDARDTRRVFNEEPRRILWNADASKKCAICGQRIRAWKDMNADHIQAYVRGGPTTLGIGAITHSRCNQQKDAK